VRPSVGQFDSGSVSICNLCGGGLGRASAALARRALVFARFENHCGHVELSSIGQLLPLATKDRQQKTVPRDEEGAAKKRPA
jgi:hypothetical protein